MVWRRAEQLPADGPPPWTGVPALVPFAAVSRKWEPRKESAEARPMEQTSFGNWLLRFMAAHAPKSTVTATLR